MIHWSNSMAIEGVAMLENNNPGRITDFNSLLKPVAFSTVTSASSTCLYPGNQPATALGHQALPASKNDRDTTIAHARNKQREFNSGHIRISLNYTELSDQDIVDRRGLSMRHASYRTGSIACPIVTIQPIDLITRSCSDCL